MNQIAAIKTEAKEVAWTQNRRFRVTEVCNHNGYVWVNVTGFNAEPGTTDDWEAFSLLSSSAKENFVAAQDQTVFNLSVIASSVDVYVNTVYQIETTDYDYDNGVVTFLYNLDENDVVNVRTF